MKTFFCLSLFLVIIKSSQAQLGLEAIQNEEQSEEITTSTITPGQGDFNTTDIIQQSDFADSIAHLQEALSSSRQQLAELDTMKKNLLSSLTQLTDEFKTKDAESKEKIIAFQKNLSSMQGKYDSLQIKYESNINSLNAQLTQVISEQYQLKLKPIIANINQVDSLLNDYIGKADYSIRNGNSLESILLQRFIDSSYHFMADYAKVELKGQIVPLRKKADLIDSLINTNYLSYGSIINAYYNELKTGSDLLLEKYKTFAEQGKQQNETIEKIKKEAENKDLTFGTLPGLTTIVGSRQFVPNISILANSKIIFYKNQPNYTLKRKYLVNYAFVRNSHYVNVIESKISAILKDTTFNYNNMEKLKADLSAKIKDSIEVNKKLSIETDTSNISELMKSLGNIRNAIYTLADSINHIKKKTLILKDSIGKFNRAIDAIHFKYYKPAGFQNASTNNNIKSGGISLSPDKYNLVKDYESNNMHFPNTVRDSTRTRFKMFVESKVFTAVENTSEIESEVQFKSLFVPQASSFGFTNGLTAFFYEPDEKNESFVPVFNMQIAYVGKNMKPDSLTSYTLGMFHITTGMELSFLQKLSLYANWNTLYYADNISEFKSMYPQKDYRDGFLDLGIKSLLELHDNTVSNSIVLDLGFIMVNGDIASFTNTADKVIPNIKIAFRSTFDR